MDENKKKEDEFEQEVIDCIEIPKRGAPESEIKQAAMVILSQAGMGNSAIARAVERHPNTTCRTVNKLKKINLAHPEKVKLASQVFKQVLSGFVGVKNDSGDLVTDSRVKAKDAVDAATIVYKAAGELSSGDPAPSNQLFFQVNQTFLNNNR